MFNSPFSAATLLATLVLGACGGGGASVTANPPPTAAPTATLGVSQASIAAGGAATLTWSSTNATACTAAGGWSGTLATSGTQSTGALGATTSYSLTCAGAGGTSTPATATVAVTAAPPPPPPAPTVTLTANPTTVASGGTAALTWSSTNATACTATDGWSGTLATSGTQSTAALSATTLYSMTCTGAGGTSTPVTATVAVTAATLPAPTVTLTATPTAVASGGTSMLTWTSTNATACSATGGWSGALATGGTQSTGALSATTVYSLTCTGVGGTSAQVNATVTIAPVPTVVLQATPTTVASGGTSTLTWSSTNATGCTASGGWSGALGSSGSRGTGALTANASYSLVCTGTGGTSPAATATITITPLPRVTLAATPSVVSSGGTSTLTWSSTNATSCTAGGGWSGTQPTAGSQSTGAVTATTSYTLVCTNASGTGSATATITVSSGTVSVVPSVAALTISQIQQFTATVPGGGAATWTVDGIAGGNASVGTVDATGLYTAGTAPGAHGVEATSVANTSDSGASTAVVTDLQGVFTYHNDLARDGANLQEYALNPGNVNTAQFGKRAACTVDGAIYAQPLWEANLAVGATSHNVVFVATQHDSLYAFDADASPCGSPLWQVSLIDTAHGGTSGETVVLTTQVGSGSGDITPEIGVTSTPVIDPANGILYVLAKSVKAGQFYQRLHAIDPATGNEMPGAPMLVAGSVAGTGDGGTTVSFDAKQQLQRAGLALVNGVVYAAFASHEDNPPYHGWMMGYRYAGNTLSQTAIFATTPNGTQGGIWMSGGAPAADVSGNLYVTSGNGDFNAANGNYGDSLLQLSAALGVTSSFTPSDQAPDQANDADFCAGGAAMLADLPNTSPVPHLIVCGGKDEILYVLNRDNLGGAGDSHAVQTVHLPTYIMQTGAFWNNNFYLASLSYPLTAYQVDPTVPQLNVGTVTAAHFTTGSPSVSAAAALHGIVWALDNSAWCTPESGSCGPAVLYAYDATNLTSMLWNSSQANGDVAGHAVKFTVPTVANGKVYIGTRGSNSGGAYGSGGTYGELDIYGLKP